MHSACSSEVSLSTWLKKKRIRHFLPLNLTSSLFFLGEKQGEDGDVAQAWASNHWPLRCRGGAFTSRTHADKTPFMMLKQHQTHQMAARLLQSGPRRRLAPEEATLKSAIVRVLAMIDEAASERASSRQRTLERHVADRWCLFYNICPTSTSDEFFSYWLFKISDWKQADLNWEDCVGIHTNWETWQAANTSLTSKWLRTAVVFSTVSLLGSGLLGGGTGALLKWGMTDKRRGGRVGVGWGHAF